MQISWFDVITPLHLPLAIALQLVVQQTEAQISFSRSIPIRYFPTLVHHRNASFLFSNFHSVSSLPADVFLPEFSFILLFALFPPPVTYLSSNLISDFVHVVRYDSRFLVFSISFFFFYCDAIVIIKLQKMFNSALNASNSQRKTFDNKGLCWW